MTDSSVDRRGFLKRAAGLGAMLGGVMASATAQAARPRGTVSLPMPQKELGTTGQKIPIISQGTSQRLDLKYDRLLHGCFREGVTYLDTALSYGWGASHAAVANFIQQIGDRDKLWLTSKSQSTSVAGLRKDLDQCREELGVDAIDLYFMHGIYDEDLLEPDFIKLGDQLRKSGKTRFFGFSCHDGNVVRLLNKAAKVGGIDAIMFRYNFHRYGDSALNRAMDACKKAGIGLIAMKTQGGVSSRAEKVVDFRSKKFTLGQAKLKSVWADERIDSICSEMDSVKYLRENIAAAKSRAPLTAGEMHQLGRLAAATAHLACQGCSHYCEATLPRPVAIADSLRFLMYHEVYGKPSRARELYRDLPEEKKHFEGLDLSAAAAACPQGINIAARLGRARQVLA